MNKVSTQEQIKVQKKNIVVKKITNGRNCNQQQQQLQR